MASSLSYCSHCGGELTERAIEGRGRAYCPSCTIPIYRNPKPTAGILVVDGDELLLVKRSVPPSVGAWSVPAGYLEHDEPPQKAAVRELEEETGLVTTQSAIELFDTAFVGHPDGSHVLVVIYRTNRQNTNGEPIAGSDADGAKFWSLEELDAAGEHVEPGYMEKFERAVQ